MFKKIIFLMLIFTLCSFSLAEDDESSLYTINAGFIDDPFAGQKIIQDKDYNNILQKKQNAQKPSKFWTWVFKHTMPKEEKPTVQYREQFDVPSETYLPEEALKTKAYLTLGTSIYDSEGSVIPSGHYQVIHKDGKLILKQGLTNAGFLNARATKDEWSENQIIYARVIYINDNYAKIIYSHLNECYEGYARIKN